MSVSGGGIRDDARKIARCVDKKVLDLQEEFLSNDRRSSTAARAKLARLRRLGTPGGGGWFFVGFDVFAGLPESLLSRHKNKRMFQTLWETMRLYAIHQQSQTVPMAIADDQKKTCDQKDTDDQKDKSLYYSFGWSCRQIEYDLDESKGIRSRLAAIEAAGCDFDGIEHNVRALITLMRSKSVPVNYYALAYHLYLLQFHSTREEVLISWGCDYFANEKSGEKKTLYEV